MKRGYKRDGKENLKSDSVKKKIVKYMLYIILKMSRTKTRSVLNLLPIVTP